MDNKSAFNENQYDENIRKVIPSYDEIHHQSVDLIKTYFGDRELALLDTGCGTGSFGMLALEKLCLSELVLCDPSEKMLGDAKEKLLDSKCTFLCIGSESLDFENRFDVITAIQSHHYFDRGTREKAVQNCFRALKSGGMFLFSENTAPFSEVGRAIGLKRVEKFSLNAGRSLEDVISHSARYNTGYFPITITEHLELLHRTGFKTAELFFHSYIQSGFYAVK